ncbi:MAG: hypothetical protein ACR2OB_13955 [Solirubrobacteraceae bacterium]
MSSFPARAGAQQAQTDYGEYHVERVRHQIQADDKVLREARRRRDRVRALAEGYLGALRSFPSGSLAHGTVRKPVKDADSGVVLDRRTWPQLGPDGSGVGPCQIVQHLAEFIYRELVRHWPAVTYEISKRAIVFEFHEPLGNEDPQEDPSVDLIVGLTRQEAPGLWIPDTWRDGWNPSHPERHTELMTANPAELRVVRARTIRLTKAIIGADGEHAVLSSFNIEALAYYSIRQALPTQLDGLTAFLQAVTNSIAAGPTLDPAEVSPPIKLPDGISQEQAVLRLSYFASCAADAARDCYGEQAVLAALGRLFPEQLPEAPQSSKDKLAAALAAGSAGDVVTMSFRRPIKKTTPSYSDAGR